MAATFGINFADGFYVLQCPNGEFMNFPTVSAPVTPPANTVAPTITGSTAPGSTVTFHWGTWTNASAVKHDVYLDDVLLLADVTDGQQYVLLVGQLTQSLTLRETPDNTPVLGIASAPVVVLDVAPVITGVPDQSFTRNDGNKSLSAALYTTGARVVYSATSPGVVIDPATGDLAFSTEELVPSTSVVITAENSGGSDTDTLLYEVTAGTDPGDPGLAAIDVATVTVSFRPDDSGETITNVPAGFSTWMFTLSAPPAGVASLDDISLIWRGDPDVEGQTLGSGYYPCIRHQTLPNTWIARAITSATNRTPILKRFLYVNDPVAGTGSGNCIGQSKTQHLAYYITANAPGGNAIPTAISARSAAITQVVTLFEEPPVGGDLVSRLLIEMNAAEGAEVANGYKPGVGMQILYNAMNCESVPERGYAVGDSNGLWAWNDNYWWRPAGRGLYAPNGGAIWCDPANPAHLLVYMTAAYNKPEAGLYRSLNSGEDFQPRKVDTSAVNSSHGRLGAIAGDPQSVSGGITQRLYCALARTGTLTTVTRYSVDGGETWLSPATALGTNKGIPLVARFSPVNANRMWLGTSIGLYVVTNPCSSSPVYTLIASGDYNGTIYISADGATVRAGRVGGGIYGCTNGNAAVGSITWAQLSGTFTGCSRYAIHPTDPTFVIGFDDDQTDNIMHRSVNSGATMTRVKPSAMEVRPGSPGYNSTTKKGTDSVKTNPSMVAVGANAAMFDPDDVNNVWVTGKQNSQPTANSHFSSTDKGATWKLWNWGFDGHNFKHYRTPHGMFGSKLKVAMCQYDVGVFLSKDGGFTGGPPIKASMIAARTAAGYTSASPNVSSGALVHPTKTIICAAVGDYGSNHYLLRSTDDGQNWSAPLPGVGVKDGCFLRNWSNSDIAMWYRYRSVDGNYATWTAMSTMPSGHYTISQTYKTSGTNYFLAANNSTPTSFSRSGDNGATWTTVLTLPSGHRSGGATDLSITIGCIDPQNENIIWVLDAEGFQYRFRRYDVSTGTSATTRSYTTHNIFGGVSALPPSKFKKPPAISYMQVDPRNGSVIWAAVGPAGQSYLYRSIDAGASFQEITGAIASQSSRSSLVVNPYTGECWTGNDQGVYVIPPHYAHLGGAYDIMPHGQHLAIN